MPNITLAISDGLHERLKTHSEIRWSEVMRKILERNMNRLELMNKILENSKLTEQDVEEISHKIDSSVAKKLGLK